jgi:TonB family protein
VRRGDVATHLLARMALVLHWWNPLAWIAWRKFIQERERATDDLVLSVGARASEYASHLLEIARSMQSPAPSAWAAVAMARPSQLEGRLLAILDSRIHRAASTRFAPLAAAILAVAMMAPFAAVRAQDSARQPVPPDVDATIRAAAAQKNHEILERAASVYEGLKNYDVAQSLLENALAIRAEKTGQQGGEYAAGLVKLGDLAYKRRQYDEANSFYAKAVALGDRPEIASALFHLGIKSYKEKDVNAALDLFQRAYNVDPKGPQAGPALTWMANARQLDPGTENDADHLYQQALALEDPNSVEAATTMEFYSFFLRKHDRTTEATPMESRAQEVRRGIVSEMMKKEFGSEGSQPAFRVNAGEQINIVPHPGAPTKAAERTASGAYRVGAGVMAPRLLKKLEPQYSEEARAMKLQGTVLLSVIVGVDGHASDIQVIKNLGLGLDENAVEAVTQWVFQPGTLNGGPVPVMATIEVNFRLM